MLNVALEFLNLPISQIGFYTPFSDDGKDLVKKCCPDGFYIAK